MMGAENAERELVEAPAVKVAVVRRRELPHQSVDLPAEPLDRVRRRGTRPGVHHRDEEIGQALLRVVVGERLRRGEDEERSQQERAPHATTFAARSPAISSGMTPAWRSTSSVCSPSAGAWVRIPPGVLLKRIGVSSVVSRPARG